MIHCPNLQWLFAEVAGDSRTTRSTQIDTSIIHNTVSNMNATVNTCFKISNGVKTVLLVFIVSSLNTQSCEANSNLLVVSKELFSCPR